MGKIYVHLSTVFHRKLLIFSQKNCSNLEVLDLDNCMFSTNLLRLPLERLQISCPKLRVLALTNSLVRVNDVSKAEQVKHYKCSLNTEAGQHKTCPSNYFILLNKKYSQWHCSIVHLFPISQS